MNCLNRYLLLVIISINTPNNATSWWHHATFQTITEKITHTYKPESKSTLELQAVDGSIELKRSQNQTLSVHALKTGIKEELPRTDIEYAVKDNTVSIKTIHKDNENPIRVDYTIEVPQTIEKIIISSTSGAITISDLDAAYDIKKTKGDLTISGARHSSHIVIHEEGSVNVSYAQFGSDASVFIETLRGTINLVLPLKTNASIKLQTLEGKVTSDIPITLDAQKTLLNKDYWNSVKKYAKGIMGSGGPSILIETIQGNIAVKTSEKTK